jgi:FkbM family methyltransferase
MSIARAVWTFSLQKAYQIFKRSFLSKPSLKIYEVESGECKGIKLKLDSSFVRQHKNLIKGTYEDFLINALKSHLKLEGKTIWDIGAHIGFQTFSFARNVGEKGHVFSFEPNPNNFESLTENIKLNGTITNIHPQMIAISKEQAVMPFQISRYKNHPTTLGGYLSDIIPPEDKSIYKDFKSINVDVESIDNLIYTKNYSVPDVIKIDIEGAELNALLGAKKLLNSEERPILIIEIHTVSMMFHVMQLLLQAAYTIDIIDDHVDFFTKNIICIPVNKQ